MTRYRVGLSRDPMFWLGCYLFAVVLVIAMSLDWSAVAFLVWSERAR